MLQEIARWIEEAVRKLDYSTDQITDRWVIERPDDLARGDYATNVALALGKKLKKSPLDLAKQIADQLKASPLEFPKAKPWLERIEVITPGFINFFLTRDFFTNELQKILEQGDKYGEGRSETGEKVMVEYTDPNPFKEFHIGHLMSNTIGESISRLIASQGAEVKRACYQGDVGMHVAKAIYGNLKLKTQNEKLDEKEEKIREWGKAYAFGARAYESDETARREIGELNRKIYDRSDKSVNALHDEGRQASLDYFEEIYKRLGTKFDYYFSESQTAEIGKKLVEGNTGTIFERSEGAVIFRGGRDLHSRVFLTSEGLPTYEAKELGLAKLKFERYPHDQSIVITGNEITGYFAVVKKVLESIFPDLAQKIKHLPHGMLRLASGKMSSRTGTLITAENLLAEVKTAVNRKISERDFNIGEREAVTEAVAVAAIKYSILKQSPGRDIIFDPARSLSLEGDSGPYLQYAYVRARAVLEKGMAENVPISLGQPPAKIGELERRLIRFPETVARAAALSAPNFIVTYLTELAGVFNAYYAVQKIVDPTDLRSPYRLAVTSAFSNVMRSGLTLLAVPVLEKM